MNCGRLFIFFAFFFLFFPYKAFSMDFYASDRAAAASAMGELRSELQRRRNEPKIFNHEFYDDCLLSESELEDKVAQNYAEAVKSTKDFGKFMFCAWSGIGALAGIPWVGVPTTILALSLEGPKQYWIAYKNTHLLRKKKAIFDDAMKSGDFNVTTAQHLADKFGSQLEQLINDDRENPLHLACKNGKLELVKSFLKACDIEKTTSNGHTALAVAVSEGHSEVVKYLLSHGANPRKVAWHIAKIEGKNEILKLVVQYQIDELRQQEDSECSICMNNDSNDQSARFSICDYQCLTPICRDCKAILPDSKCPFCRADLCQDLDA